MLTPNQTETFLFVDSMELKKKKKKEKSGGHYKGKRTLTTYCWWGLPLLFQLHLHIQTITSSQLTRTFKPSLSVDKNIQTITVSWQAHPNHHCQLTRTSKPSLSVESVDKNIQNHHCQLTRTSKPSLSADKNIQTITVSWQEHPNHHCQLTRTSKPSLSVDKHIQTITVSWQEHPNHHCQLTRTSKPSLSVESVDKNIQNHHCQLTRTSKPSLPNHHCQCQLTWSHVHSCGHDKIIKAQTVDVAICGLSWGTPCLLGKWQPRLNFY